MSDNERTNDSLRMLQALPLNLKVPMTQARIRAWYQNFDGKVYCSFSGGKDSTVQLDIVRSMYPEVKAVFSNTGLEYPEIQHFAKSFDNVDVVTPKLRFNEVVSTYGYPLISKEVAQAIYYARRIVKSDRPEKERARSIQQLLGVYPGSGDSSCWESEVNPERKPSTISKKNCIPQ